MPATVTLNTTTLANFVGPTDGQIKVASTAGLTPGTKLFVDREFMSVVSLGVDPWVNVLRGMAGSATSQHDATATVYIGTADQFYDQDPQGPPPEATPVSPWINVRDGRIWFAQGNAFPVGSNIRWWQQQTATYAVGPLGITTTTLSPTSST